MFDTYSTRANSLEQKTKLNMHTRSSSKIPLSECTEFTMHISQKTEFTTKHKFIDYTEFKLRKYIKTILDKQQELVLITMLSDYIQGNIAVAWRRGQPVYIKVTKE